MLPDLTTILIAFIAAFFISIMTIKLSKKLGFLVEISLIVAYIAILFISFPFQESIFLFTIAAATYAEFETLFNRSKYEKREQLLERLHESTFVEIEQTKKLSRLVVDLLLTAFVMAGGIIFLLFAPESYALLKFLIILAFIAILVKTIERMSNFLAFRRRKACYSYSLSTA